MCKSGAPTLARGKTEWGQQWWQDHSSFSNSARRWGWGLTVSQSALSRGHYWTLLKRACSERAYVALKIRYPEKRFRTDWAVLYNQIKKCCPFSFNRYLDHVSKMNKDEMDWWDKRPTCPECVSTCWTMVVNSRQSCTMLFFSNEYSVTLENGDLEEIKQRLCCFKKMLSLENQ